MRIAVCDDDTRGREQFERALRELDPAQSAEKFSDGAALLKAAKQTPPFDIVFLDIYMPGENGIDIAKELRSHSPKTAVVFVTVSREHAVDAFSVYATHYLIKPVTAEGISEVFNRITKARPAHRESVTLTVGTDRHTVSLDQISLLESDNHAVNVSLSDGRTLRVRTSFSDLVKKMDKNFLKVNRGIVVNMDYISQMGTDICVLRDGTRLPIAIRRSASIRAAYDDYVFDRLSRRRSFKEDRT